MKLVHVGQGPVQIEMHFYFFALLAMLAVYGNPLVILVAAVTVALHHLVLWALLPASVFNYDAPIWVVAGPRRRSWCSSPSRPATSRAASSTT